MIPFNAGYLRAIPTKSSRSLDIAPPPIHITRGRTEAILTDTFEILHHNKLNVFTNNTVEGVIEWYLHEILPHRPLDEQNQLIINQLSAKVSSSLAP